MDSKLKITRSLSRSLAQDLDRKIVLIAGPRQCGKTTLSKSLSKNFEYLNYDNLDDRAQILARQWDRKKNLIIFDELHKMPKWKSWLKGIYDKEGHHPALLVTGSARLNAYKKTGDSLAGRHFYFRLHPFDLKELTSSGIHLSEKEIFHRLLNVGGYPEPFLNGDENEYRRWRQGHMDIILRQDLVDLENVRDVRSLELLIQLLRTRVGSGISINALAIDLQKDHKTVQRWLEILEDLFIVFRVTPYSKNIERAVKKEPKFYFYDTGFVRGDDSQKLENLVACALLKECHSMTDVQGRPYELNLLKIKGGRALDFILVPEGPDEPALIVEVKLGDAEVSPNFKLFQHLFRGSPRIQLVQNLKREFTTAEGVEVRKASAWLSTFSI